VTLNDVAALASVSYQTVSRVINGKGEVTDETRRRVLAAIQDLGYRPNTLARGLARGRTHTLGVVTADFYRFGPSRIATGIQRHCQELGYLLLVQWLSNTESSCCQDLNDLAGHQVDAIVWLGTELQDDLSWAEPAFLDTLPPVVFCNIPPRPGLPAARIDNRVDAANMTRHLLAQGRRHIGMISGPMERFIPRERVAGWREAMVEAGLSPSTELLVHGDWSADSGVRGFRQLMSRVRHLDAILASNDRMALGVLHAAREAGMRVPDDLAVAGFDNIPESAFFTPPLTTVQQPLMELGRIAADMAIDLAKARWENQPGPAEAAVVLPSELVIRASTRSC
jgi:DNA-binding LacI/PurR family transcriptional regulator